MVITRTDLLKRRGSFKSHVAAEPSQIKTETETKDQQSHGGGGETSDVGGLSDDELEEPKPTLDHTLHHPVSRQPKTRRRKDPRASRKPHGKKAGSSRSTSASVSFARPPTTRKEQQPRYWTSVLGPQDSSKVVPRTLKRQVTGSELEAEKNRYEAVIAGLREERRKASDMYDESVQTQSEEYQKERSNTTSKLKRARGAYAEFLRRNSATASEEFVKEEEAFDAYLKSEIKRRHSIGLSKIPKK